MKFSEVVAQTLAWLQREGRVSYRALKREFELDDEFLEDVKAELIDAKRIAADEDGKVLVWVGDGSLASRVQSLESEKQRQAPLVQTLDARPRTLDAAAERRQLTVMFCDLVGSTALSAQLDPEDYRAVVQAYHTIGVASIEKYEGHLAQYLGDGLLVYFGFPAAHEDDARRAVRAGLEIIETLRQQVPFPLRGEVPSSPSPFQGEGSTSSASAGEGNGNEQLYNTPHPNPLPQGARGLQVRIGIHTGLVVVGEIGEGKKREMLALGETPNLAARLQGLAEPNTVFISAATQRLIDTQFECQPFGSHLLKGIDTPIAVYHVQSERQAVSSLAGKTTLTPLVGREQEVGLLLDRWEQAKEGRGQVVLLSGEPGIGKSRLAYTLREHVASEGSLLFEARCSPYHQHSALYPLIEVLQRTLLLTRQDTDDEKVTKLERALSLYDMQESLPLFTALLSLPTPSQYPPLTFTPQKQKERTLQALLQLLVAQAERQATVSVWEDLHWADPSSLEFLTLLLEQIPTTKLLLVLTFRPEFTPPWKPRSHISQLVLNRLGKKQVEAMIEKVAERKGLSAEVIEQIRLKTDGVPLFVEELTKSVVESVGSIGSIGSIESPHHMPRQLAIPATLQEALLARLDRLSTARQVAQLGATLGREFSYELLHAVTPLSETNLQTALTKLVEAEILYQRGVEEQARYFFKHALIQDTAYQSLLKSTRQQYHQQIAQVLAERFPDAKANQPEVLAHHYTEAGLIEQAIPYWQQAGQQAAQRSANTEAIKHLTKGLELLRFLSDTPKRARQELTLQLALGVALQATKGFTAPEVERVYSRARELCRQVGETSQLFPSLWGLWAFYNVRGELETARKLGEQLLTVAQSEQDPTFLLQAHYSLGVTLVALGEFTLAREHFEQSLVLYDLRQHRLQAFRYGAFDPKVAGLSFVALVLWVLGYPDQALNRSQEALVFAHDLSHPSSLAQALIWTAWLHQYRREEQMAQDRAEAAISLSTDQGFPLWLGMATVFLGKALAEQGQEEAGTVQIRQGVAMLQAIGVGTALPYYLALLAEAYGKTGQTEEGLALLTEALVHAHKYAERLYKAELYRLKGELTLQQQLKVESPKSKVPNTQPLTPNPQAEAEAEACFLKAIEIARKQQAKSWELRASTNLARLWQQQGKQHEARNTLSEIYSWFTEGFDTKDLQEAKALIEELRN
jgi:class 3 adenylate cyclase/predicted ATPase